MKSAAEWSMRLKAVQSGAACCPRVTLKDIRTIQLDALEWAVDSIDWDFENNDALVRKIQELKEEGE